MPCRVYCIKSTKICRMKPTSNPPTKETSRASKRQEEGDGGEDEEETLEGEAFAVEAI